MRFFFILSIILLTFLSCSESHEKIADTTFDYKVIRVLDGDSMIVIRDGKKETIRVFGIDCPEKGQSFGNIAKKYAKKELLNKSISLNIKTKDQYGRTVAEIFYQKDSLNINYGISIVKDGLAWRYKRYNNDPEYRKAERFARDKKNNIWSEKEPIEPWKFRKAKRLSR